MADSLVVSAGTVGSLSVSIHPLVILNISDHWVRTKAQHGDPKRVYGVLRGKLSGHHVEIFTSFEHKLESGEDLRIDMDYYHKKDQQFKEVFGEYDYVGLYTTGRELFESDRIVHIQSSSIVENPVLLLLDPISSLTDRPFISVYESIVDLVAGQTRIKFVTLPFTLATEETERLAIKYVSGSGAAASGTAGSATSHVADHFNANFSAIKMLLQRVRVLLAYVQDVRLGLIEQPSSAILRDIKSLCESLCLLPSDNFKSDYAGQQSDVLLQTYLAIITKSCHTITEFTRKFSTCYGRTGLSTGGRVYNLY